MQSIRIAGTILSLLIIAVFAKEPEWVLSKPVSSSSYIGIGVAVKDQFKSKDEWIKAAEARALSGISEAISVSIESSSKLTQTATNTEIKDLYQENIRTFTKSNLEGYQFVECWENKKEYWVYYKLDKAVWQAAEQKRLRESLAKSQSYLDNAVKMHNEGSIVSSLRSIIQAYSELIPVMHLDPRFTVNGTAVPAEAHIDSKMMSLLNSISIDMKKPIYNGTKSAFGTKEPKITVKTVSFSVGSFPLIIGSEKRMTSGDGSVSIGKSFIEGREPDAGGTIVLPVSTDRDQLLPAQNSAVVSKWMSKFRWPSADALFKFTKPAVYVESAETQFTDLPYQELETAVKSKLGDIGYGIAKTTGEADLRVVLKSTGRTGGSMGNLYFSYIDLSWSIFNQEGDELFTEQLTPVKDGALSYEDASLKAYRKAGVLISTRVTDWIAGNRK